ncbi:hypothetical protein BS47DRAFT_1338722 [Hydnum rufescens UP504]|uniref:DBF4-type domain-containing protein n=1 Tax=Hydnum rufescens UP504 TaxID=1448309 RepID=A0A9P6B8C1_9AGAM|nr:hypothetical protein BS47DRAFT_1338722 [Hydnum rufescens UP504]
MSSVPATPRRQALINRQTHALYPTALPAPEKSPSIRSAQRHQRTLTQRPTLIHKQSHPPIKTPTSSVLHVPDITATAPARVPVPKRSRDDQGNDDDDDGHFHPARANPSWPSNRLGTKHPRPQVHSHEQPERLAKKAKLEERVEERLRQEERFKDKYTRAFPGFKFYFDSLDASVKHSFSSRVQQLGARIEDFFSASVTHFISNKQIPSVEDIAALENKENAPASTTTSAVTLTTAASNFLPPRPVPHRNSQHATVAPPPLRSPIKLRPSGATAPKYDALVAKAVHFQMKIWDEKKLDNILSRLLPSAPTIHPHSKFAPPSLFPAPASVSTHTNPGITVGAAVPTLSYLLQTERNSGLTLERDPTALRRDYKYFGQNSYWVLIEDIDGTHAPIAVKDYGRWRPKRAMNKATRKKKRHSTKYRTVGGFLDEHGATSEFSEEEDHDTPWPKLRDARGKAKPDWAEGKLGSLDEADSHNESMDDDREPQEHSRDMDNQEDFQDGEDAVVFDFSRERDEDSNAEDQDVLDASSKAQVLRRTASLHDFGRSTLGAGKSTKSALEREDREYVAASGNSVVITSHINSTTSFATHLDGTGSGLGGIGRAVGAGRLLNKRLHQQVLTHRTLKAAASAGGTGEDDASVSLRPHVLRKSKSTNTLRPKTTARLPRREEVKKPGYCENCRVRFDDFGKHVSGKKHQKFSNDDENFWQLDEILGRLGRKTLEQVEEEEHTWLSEGLRRLHSESTAMEDDGPHDDQEQEQQEFADQDDYNREAEEAASEQGGSVFDVSGEDDGAMMTPRPHETHDHTEWIDLYDY